MRIRNVLPFRPMISPLSACGACVSGWVVTQVYSRQLARLPVKPVSVVRRHLAHLVTLEFLLRL